MKNKPANRRTHSDQIFWTDELTGYRCHMFRDRQFQCVCAYVGIPASHPYYNVSVRFLERELPDWLQIAFAGARDGMPGYNWIGFFCREDYDAEPVPPLTSFEAPLGTLKILELLRQNCRNLALELYGRRFTRSYAVKIFSIKIPFSRKIVSVYRDGQGTIISTARRLPRQLKQEDPDEDGQNPEYFDPLFFRQ